MEDEPVIQSAPANESEPTALVCVDDPKLLNKVLSELDGVKFAAPFSVDDAISRLKSGKYDLIVLSETFRSASRHENRVLQEINRLNEDRRMEEFVVLIGPALPTGDVLTAFACSADAVLNSKDLGKIGEMFHQGRARKEAAYSRFMEIGRSTMAR
jgi:hypothetical protein